MSRIEPGVEVKAPSGVGTALELASTIVQDGGRRAETAPEHFANSFALMAAVVDSSDDAIVSKTLEGRILSWNAGAQRIFGWTAEEAVGQSITLIIPPDRLDEETEILRRLRNGERVDHFETVRVGKDGRAVHVSVTISPVRNAQGVIIGASKIARDVSERKRALEVLREETRVLEVLNRVGKTLVAAQLDLERVVQVATDAGRELSGAAFGAFFYNVRDEKGDSYTLYTLSGASRESFAQFPMPRRTAVFAPTFEGEAVVRSDDITKDPRYGKSKPHFGMPAGHLPLRSYLAVPVVSGSGEVIGGLFYGHPQAGIFTDRAERLVTGIASQAAVAVDNARLYQAAQREIAERARAEEALRLNERLYRAIGDSIDFGIWICDPDGRNIYASESFLKLVGLTQHQCSEFGWGDVLHPDDAERTITAWRDCVRGSSNFWDMEHRFRGVDGRYHPVLARGVPVRDDEGKVIAWVGLNLDISKLKTAEDALREADRRKDEFLAVLAHELRNPLAPIRYALAISRKAGRSDEQRKRSEEIIGRQIEHMSRLLDDLLDVSRITRGTLDLRRSRIELTSAIAAAIEAARPLLDSKRHVLSLELPHEPIRLDADPVRMAQVFANLLINAAKYTDPGGRIELRASRSAGEIVVAVRDNGIGIAPEVLPRLFTLFSQADPARERSEGGLGIGLALARGLVALHGGTIEARSEGAQRGSEFVVRLPEGDEESRPSTDESEPASLTAGARLRVLVADDNRDSADTCATLLELSGHEVQRAYNGRQALECAERFHPHVLLLDIGMPEANGYAVAEQIRSASWARRSTLVAITGWGQDEDKRRALAAGFDHHLTKPIDPAALESLLRSIGASLRP